MANKPSAPDSRTCLALLAIVATGLWLPPAARGATYYVRQTTGDDAKDGLTPATAWAHVTRLGVAMQAGDTAYVGPGLYREEIAIQNDGRPDARLIFVADTTGQHTGDPPGVVMLTGAEPVDETIFVPDASAGVYRTPFTAFQVVGVVEMDGPQYRYGRADQPAERQAGKAAILETLAKTPSTYFYDGAEHVLYIHTSDGRPPATHEIEVFRRGNGISMSDKHFVTVMGFTFRSMGDSGINFFKGSSDGIAVDNTAWGSRQGIRVYGATNILVYRNTLFRNENSGTYFAAASVNGVALANTCFENVKGLRWSSQSVNGMALDNVLFDNHEAGISIESVSHELIRRNHIARNEKTQLLSMESEYDSEDNCFDTGDPDRFTADFVFTEHYRTLREYQDGKHQDLHSRAGGCGVLPPKVDVHRLHAETLAYAETARRILSGPPPGAQAPPAVHDEESGGSLRRWLGTLWGGRPRP